MRYLLIAFSLVVMLPLALSASRSIDDTRALSLDETAALVGGINGRDCATAAQCVATAMCPSLTPDPDCSDTTKSTQHLMIPESGSKDCSLVVPASMCDDSSPLNDCRYTVACKIDLISNACLPDPMHILFASRAPTTCTSTGP